MWSTVAMSSGVLPTARSLSTNGCNDTMTDPDALLGTTIWDAARTLLDPGTAIVSFAALLVLALLTPWIWRLASAAYQRSRRNPGAMRGTRATRARPGREINIPDHDNGSRCPLEGPSALFIPDSWFEVGPEGKM